MIPRLCNILKSNATYIVSKAAECFGALCKYIPLESIQYVIKHVIPLFDDIQTPAYRLAAALVVESIQM